MIDLYAVDTAASPMVLFLARTYGSLIVAVGCCLAAATKARTSYGRRAILILITVANVMVGILHITAISGGIENNNAWIIVVVVFVLAIWGGLLLAREKIE